MLKLASLHLKGIHIMKGVPQESIFGPTFFAINPNEMLDCISIINKEKNNCTVFTVVKLCMNATNHFITKGSLNECY